MPSDQLLPPVQYNDLWLWLGLSLLVLMLSLPAVIMWLGRPRTVKPPVVLQPSLAQLQQKYLAQIAAVAAAYRNRHFNNRQVHTQLSLLLRQFVWETKGVAAQHFTLAEIEAANLPSLAEVIRQYYPAEFHQTPHGQAEQALELAKGLIQTWS